MRLLESEPLIPVSDADVIAHLERSLNAETVSEYDNPKGDSQ